jgi:hypothetical protein
LKLTMKNKRVANIILIFFSNCIYISLTKIENYS